MPWKKNSLGAHVVTKIATPNLRFLCNFHSFFDNIFVNKYVFAAEEEEVSGLMGHRILHGL